MRLSRRRRETISEMDMTPMIDIVFLLLIFFMTVTQVTETNRERVELPHLEGSADQEPSILTININAEDELLVSGRILTLGGVVALVSKELERLGDDPSKLTVVIRGDRRSTCGPVNRVLSAFQRLDMRRVRLAVRSS